MNPSPPPLHGPDTPGAKAGRERAWGVAIANQLALPGFGTVMAGRKIGYVQLAMSVTGVLCVTVFLVFAFPRLGPLVRAAMDPADDPEVALELLAPWIPWLGVAFGGIALWVTAWLWSWSTSARALKSTLKH